MCTWSLHFGMVHVLIGFVNTVPTHSKKCSHFENRSFKVSVAPAPEPTLFDRIIFVSKILTKEFHCEWAGTAVLYLLLGDCLVFIYTTGWQKCYLEKTLSDCRQTHRQGQASSPPTHHNNDHDCRRRIITLSIKLHLMRAHDPSFITLKPK